MDNYEKLIEFISENSGVSVEEIERKIEAKQAKLAGLISKEGAAQVIASELGVNFEKQIIKISQIVPGMRKINLVGKVIRMFPVREYNKNGRSGKIGSFILADETSNTRIVLWDENHIDLISKGKIAEENVVEITNASVRNEEVHLGSFSEIKQSERFIQNVIVDRPLRKKTINQFAPNDNVATRGFIVQIFEPRFFETCPECKKKISEIGECREHGKVIPEKRALLSFIADDGTDSIRAIIFSEQLEKIMTRKELENPELFNLKKKEFLGREMIISGQVRRNPLYNNHEFIVSDLEEIDIEKLIEELEKN